MAGPRELLTSNSVIYRNLKEVAYKKVDYSLQERVVSMATVDNYVILGLAKYGCRVFSIHEKQITPVCQFGEPPRNGAQGGKKAAAGGSTVYSVAACTKYIVYIKETAGSTSICVHSFNDVISGKTTPAKTSDVARRAPMVYEPELGLLAVGAVAWSSSWVSGETREKSAKGRSDRRLRVLDVKTLRTVMEWEVVDNSVYMLRLQQTAEHNMLGVADSQNGLCVYDLRQPITDGYTCLYHVPIEEVRSFQLVGNFVGVFHKFEPNVSFWNMKEQKTILCINIQDQMKQLVEEFYEDEDDDSGLFEDDDDNVTAVSSLPFENDHILIYGTKSGCVFGMAVDIRTKVFSIPFPHEIGDERRVKKDILWLSLLSNGKLVVCYEGLGVTILDFSPEHPPDRPPTRGQPK